MSMLPSLSGLSGYGTMSSMSMGSPVQAVTHYSLTGIPGMAGGYAYPPGSEMTRFMDSINSVVSQASAGPYGGSIVDWAQGLATQAALKKSLGGGSASGGTSLGGGTSAAGAASQLGGGGGSGALVTQLMSIMQQLQPLMAMLGVQGQ
jgi:hypothetical protein